jgi:hypothetical protein
MVATAMHKNMLYENSTNEAVLRELRQCGWAAYRPQQGKLTEAGDQPWAKKHPQSSSKIRGQVREDRLTWLDATGKPALLNTDVSMCPLQSALEVSYCEAEEEDKEDACVLDQVDVGWMEETERQVALAILIHPTLRTREQEFQVQVSEVTTQAGTGRKRKSRQEFRREVNAATWKAALGTKTVVHRLSQINPAVNKGKASKISEAAKKIKGKKGDGSATRRWRRKKKKQQRLKAAAAEAALQIADGPADGPLCEKKVYIL